MNNEFCNYVFGKTIAILGNANSLFDKDRSAQLDKYDIIVRMNKGVILDKNQLQKTTSRCELYCSSGSKGTVDLVDHITNKPDFCMWMTTKQRELAPNDFLFYPKDRWTYLYSLLGGSNFRPTTGFMVIDMFQHCTQFKKMDIFGFDFWKTKTFRDKENNRSKVHSKNEKSLILDVVNKNDQIEIIE